ncbi:MAG: phosphoglycerate dehydrogenase [Pseudomonadota bacterium]
METPSEATSLAKDKIRVLLLEGIHQSAIDSFAAAGYSNLTLEKTALQGADLAAALAETHILGIRSRSQLTAAILNQAPKLIAVGCFCIGTNQVDLGTARDRGIPVFNAPYSNTRSVAELVLAEAILLLRGVSRRSMQMHRGEWQKSASNAFEMRGKTLGVIGYGNIGAQLGVLAEALGMRVFFYDVVKKLKLGNAQQVDTLDELLAMADVVSLHVPATPQTANMIGAAELAHMKDNAVLLNASRGNVIDIDALAATLNGGRLLGAAIDVFPEEPKANGDPFNSPLVGLDNVILTPHIGGSTVEAQASIGTEVAEKLVRYSDNGSTVSAVNFPQVALPEHPDHHRLLHVHENQPGVMSHINQVFSEAGLNIAGQYLQTLENVGYVVMDIDGEDSSRGLEALRSVPGTIRTRVLF